MTYDYKVYVRTDAAGRIVEINSDAFLSNTTGWTEIDSGVGDKYHHAQGNYFDTPLMDERGIFCYKLENGKPVLRTQEEMDADFNALPEPGPTLEERTVALETASAEQDDMLAELLYEVTILNIEGGDA